MRKVPLYPGNSGLASVPSNFASTARTNLALEGAGSRYDLMVALSMARKTRW